MALVLYWANPAGMFYVGFMIFVGAGVYFGVLVLLKGFGEEEVGFLRVFSGFNRLNAFIGDQCYRKL